jgi:hypothetical protein
MFVQGRRITLTLLAGLTLSLTAACSLFAPGNNDADPDDMIGTWFFSNPAGDDEQMSIFNGGRVLVHYSNGHVDETTLSHGALGPLNEYSSEGSLLRLERGELIQHAEPGGYGKTWRRIDPMPRTALLRPLSE